MAPNPGTPIIPTLKLSSGIHNKNNHNSRSQTKQKLIRNRVILKIDELSIININWINLITKSMCQHTNM